MSAADADPQVHEVSVHVDAPPDEVWALVSDITRFGEWSPECTGGRWLRGGGPRRGALFVGTNRRGRLRWFTTNVVEEAEPGRVFAFRTHGTNVVWRYTVAAEDGGTRLTEARDKTRSRAGVIRVFGVPLGGAESHEAELIDGMAKTIAAVKATAEAEAAPAT